MVKWYHASLPSSWCGFDPRCPLQQDFSMFSVEYDHDEICITVVDDYGFHGDLKIHAFNDIVYISQWDPDTDSDSLMMISPDMWEQLLQAINSTEGVYV